MASNAFETSIQGIKSVWGPLSTDVVTACRGHLENLLKAPDTEEWLAALHKEAAPNKELYRDPQLGFVLLAHTEPAGLYRPPHDHGRGWVIYALQQGEIEMGTYARLEEPDGSVRLVKRNSTLVRPGQVQVYLPGDVHDTHCLSGPALLFRFTERDLKKEDKEEHRVTSSSFHQKHYEMKSMDFFARLGADPQSHCQCGKGMQRRMAEKDAISCSGFGETDY